MAPMQQDVVSGSNGQDNRPSNTAAIDVKRDVTEIISPLKESVTTALAGDQ